MTAEETADKLIEKYYQLLIDTLEVNTAYHYCKQCALIAVEEILNLPVDWHSKKSADGNPEVFPPSATEEYWQSVKTAIQNL